MQTTQLRLPTPPSVDSLETIKSYEPITDDRNRVKAQWNGTISQLENNNTTETVDVPKDKIDLLCNGRKITRIQKESNTKLTIESDSDNKHSQHTLRISGSHEGVARAKGMFLKLIGS